MNNNYIIRSNVEKKDTDVIVGSKLRELRQKLELSNKSVSRQINFSTSALSLIEKGKRKASFDTVLKLLKVYKSDPAQFMIDIVNESGIKG